MECLPEKNFSQDSYKSITSSSLEQCQKTCEVDKDCVAFVHSQAAQVCSLFQTTGRIVSDQAVVGGVKRQFETSAEQQSDGAI
jgi:hypothetical protein